MIAVLDTSAAVEVLRLKENQRLCFRIFLQRLIW